MKVTYLLQRTEDGKEYAYPWTDNLAQRTDMTPLTDDQYREWVERRKEAPAPVEEPEPVEDLKDNEVLEDLKASGDIDQKTATMLDQDDILKIETSKVAGFKVKAKLEAYILEKYKLSMAQGTLAEMKEQANMFLTELHSKGRLFTRHEE